VITLAVAFAVAASQPRQPVDLWSEGDDSLSQRWRVAVEQALATSNEFRPAGPADPTPHQSALLVMEHTLPGDEFQYTLSLFRGEAEVSSRIAQISGTCGERALQQCAVEAWLRLATRSQK
jgi:hypothetical protein